MLQQQSQALTETAWNESLKYLLSGYLLKMLPTSDVTHLCELEWGVNLKASKNIKCS